jgi:hypothetical protein
MAPEQVRAAHAVDWRCDLWSLGCVLYTALAGRPPFAANDELAIWAKILLEEPTPLVQVRPDVPGALGALVRRLLEKQPAHRPASAHAVAEELRRFELSDEGATGITAIGSVSHAAERRRVAVVMVGDVAGDVTLDGKEAGSRGGSAFGEVDAAPVLEQLGELAARYGGQFEGLASGAGLMTFAGSPSANDLAARAVRCAIAGRAITEAAIAVTSGRGVLSASGTLGEALERAAALLRTASVIGNRGGAIAVDDVTAGLLGARFAIERRRVGSGGDVAWVEREVAGDEPVRSVLGRHTPTLGRDRELQLLAETVADGVEQSAARAVLVTGEAGIGKSRLRRDLVDRLAGDDREPRVWLGRGDPVRAGAPFGLVAAALRWRFGAPEPAVTTEERARLAAAARAACAEAAPGDERLWAFASELAGAPIASAEAPEALRAARQSPRLMADQMRRAWLDLVAIDLATRPVAIVLDDVHWGDAPSVELIDEALRVGAERPIALIAFARPEVTELFPRLWAQRGLTHVRLGPLSRKAAVQLCSEVLGPLIDDAAIERIVARASGNPFYLEELMRAAEAGAVDALPETVLAMIQVRLEAVSPSARRVLRAASVLGTAVRRGALAAVMGSDAARELDGSVGELVTRELLVPTGDDELQFRHEIIRDAAYALLLDHDRGAAHRAAGAWLETQREREALVVAQHFERGGDRARAALWYRYASEQALDAGDPQAVIDRAARGLDCGATGEERGTLLLLQAYAFDWLGDTIAAESAAIDAMDASAEGSATWLRAAGEVAVAAARQNNLGLVSSIARHLLRCASWGDRSAYAIALAHTAAELLVSGRHDLAGRVMAKMDEVAQPADAYCEGWRLRVHAIEAAVAGDAARCLRLSQESAAELERIDARRDLVSGLVNVGFGQVEVGQYAAAEATLRRALAIADELQIVRTIAVATQNLALAVLYGGRASEALALACDAERMASEQISVRVAAGAVIYQARALIAQGRAAEALDRARRAEIATVEVPPMRAYALAVVAEAHLALGDPLTAIARARQAVEMMESLGGIDEGEHYLQAVLARASEAIGDATAAAAVAARACAKIERLAAAIDDAALRASFLEVPEIAELRARGR